MPSFTTKTAGIALALGLFSFQQVQCPPVFIAPILLTTSAVAGFAVEVAGQVIKCNKGGCDDDKRRDLSNLHARMLKAAPILAGRQVQAPKAPEGVPQFEFDRCFNDVNGKKITLEGPVEDNGIRIAGLPPTCMNLATVLDGDAAGGPPPISCGSDCLLYNNLSVDDYNKMKSALDALAKN